jgi:methionyl-tRNA formyltransferase
MFDTIILVTGEPEQGTLPAALLGHNPQLLIRPITELQQFAALETRELARSRLIAFATPLIVPVHVLDELGFGAYNFHPGPPDYPGWAPAHFALYDGATSFGATVHVMTERVDSGPIVDVAAFPVPANIGVTGLEGLAYAHLARMYWKLARRLATEAAPLPVKPLNWGGRKNSRRAYQAICDIPLDISKEELERRMRVFGGNQFDMSPTIHLHGVEFRAVG